MNVRVIGLAVALLLCIGAATSRASSVLYGVTPTHLVTIDPLNPADVTVIGPHNQADLPFNLAYDPVNDALVGLTVLNVSNVFTRTLVQYDRQSGQGTPLATLGSWTQGAEDALEYVHSRSSLFVTRTPPASAASAAAYDMDLAGNQTFIVTLNVADNDSAAYDSARDILYTIDGNNIDLLMEINLVTGDGTSHGPLPPGDALEGAYSPDLDRIYIKSEVGGPTLYYTDADPTNISFQSAGVIGANVAGIAFVPAIVIPLPSAFLAGAALLDTISLRRRRLG